MLRITSGSLKSTRSIMPEFQPVAPAHVSAIERPKCPNCHQNRMLLSKLEAGLSGSDYRTFECQKCGRIHRVVVSNDPLTSEMVGWLGSELRPPK
jgi:DNA-directed RNA polymerase subunit M/transcription elongation factor TFIIS